MKKKEIISKQMFWEKNKMFQRMKNYFKDNAKIKSSMLPILSSIA